MRSLYCICERTEISRCDTQMSHDGRVFEAIARSHAIASRTRLLLPPRRRVEERDVFVSAR